MGWGKRRGVGKNFMHDVEGASTKLALMLSRRALLRYPAVGLVATMASAALAQGSDMVSPFRIAIDDAVLDDLRQRLRRTRFADQIGDAWSYGTDLGYLRDLVGYWAEGFDWRRQEERLNRLAQFTADIEGERIHFVHIEGTGANPIPLLLLHGWPSTFVQFERMIPLLVDASAPNFTIVAASLPGYGFSAIPRAPGMGVSRIGALLHKLMVERLGYHRYGIRSSDLGAGVASVMVRTYADAIIGSHTGGTNPFVQQVPENLTIEEQEFVRSAQQWMQSEMAYAMEHTSKPQTIGNALNDSPAGLASWIIEKYRRWGDTGGHIESRFSKDDLLTNLTIYWATETITSSMRLYYEAARDPGAWGGAPSSVPVAMLMSSKDMFPTPRSWVERQGPIARWTEIDRGGHFLEQEEPALVAADLRAFFSSLT
jgi:pimeloyl-ACP methyl ester carboxylesterase